MPTPSPNVLNSSPGPRGFLRWVAATIVLTYVLVGVGAFVRVSGAGLGCPDWPKCFGRWVPPTSAADLPPGVDASKFVPLLTWIEYLNRLVGAALGIFMLVTLAHAVRHHRTQRAVLWPTVLAFVGVLYAAWLGGRVVAHELAPWIVTAHLLSALFVVGSLLVAGANALLAEHPLALPPERRGAFILGLATWMLTLLQGGLGTQVRGTIEDAVRRTPGLPRGSWVAEAGPLQSGHANLAILVAAATFALLLVVMANPLRSRWVTRAAMVSAALCLLQLSVGLVLAHAAMPRAAQVLHLELGALLVGALTVLLHGLARAPSTPGAAA